jgi:hypothetical protein
MADTFDTMLPVDPSEPLVDLEVMLNETSRILHMKKDGSGQIKELVWASNAEAYAQDITFDSSTDSDALTTGDDEEVTASNLYPSEIPNEITEGKPVAVFSEINAVNNCGQAIESINLRQHVAQKAPASLTQATRGRDMRFKSSGAAVNLKGTMKKLSYIFDDISIKRNGSSLWVRTQDVGSVLAVASASSLKVTLSGYHHVIMSYGVDKEIVWAWLSNKNL